MWFLRGLQGNLNIPYKIESETFKLKQMSCIRSWNPLTFDVLPIAPEKTPHPVGSCFQREAFLLWVFSLHSPCCTMVSCLFRRCISKYFVVKRNQSIKIKRVEPPIQHQYHQESRGNRNLRSWGQNNSSILSSYWT